MLSTIATGSTSKRGGFFLATLESSGGSSTTGAGVEIEGAGGQRIALVAAGARASAAGTGGEVGQGSGSFDFNLSLCSTSVSSSPVGDSGSVGLMATRALTITFSGAVPGVSADMAPAAAGGGG